PLIALAVAWVFVNESAPWRAVTGLANMDVEDAWQIQDGNADLVRPSMGIPSRFLILIIIGIAQDVAFVYFSYGVGYSYFQLSLATMIPVIGGLTMAVVGVVFGLAFAERVARKKFTLFSYGVLVAFWAILMGVEMATGSTAGLLLVAIMTILFIPGELTWAARGMLEPELFPTRRRGIYMSIVRFSVWVGAGIIIGLLTFRTMPFIVTSSIVMLIFVLSLSMTALWYTKGFETRSMSLAGLDKAAGSKGDGMPGKK
ncbi:MAG: MFS transporter, partial [Thermoplasmatales archaeon]